MRACGATAVQPPGDQKRGRRPRRDHERPWNKRKTTTDRPNQSLKIFVHAQNLQATKVSQPTIGQPPGDHERPWETAERPWDTAERPNSLMVAPWFFFAQWDHRLKGAIVPFKCSVTCRKITSLQATHHSHAAPSGVARLAQTAHCFGSSFISLCYRTFARDPISPNECISNI